MRKEEGRSGGVCVKRAADSIIRVSPGLQTGTLPGVDKGTAFLHILPSPIWHSSQVIGYLKGRSCSPRNDFLSPTLDDAARPPDSGKFTYL